MHHSDAAQGLLPELENADAMTAREVVTNRRGNIIKKNALDNENKYDAISAIIAKESERECGDYGTLCYRSHNSCLADAMVNERRIVMMSRIARPKTETALHITHPDVRSSRTRYSSTRSHQP
jgi:hypothetical protein